MEKSLLNRVLSWMLVAAIVCGFVIPVQASEQSAGVQFQQVDNSAVTATLPGHAPVESSQEHTYAETDEVRVSIVLDKAPTMLAGFELEEITEDASAMAYRQELQTQQQKVTASIEKRLDQKLDVAWNLTLAANLISANVQYGQIEEIEQIPGVQKVLIETRYEPAVVQRENENDPNMATSSKQIGSAIAWATGYTGAGTRVAVIDTGIDKTHQSFSDAGYQHSLACLAEEKGMTPEEYVKTLNLLDADKVRAVSDQLNVKVDPDQAFVSSKLPFAYNYVDQDYYVTHAEDDKSEHGSHVSGIAAANAYIPNKDGTFAKALDSVKVQGVAPDAQIITMKVFGKKGGAYDSDYMAAIEDAIVLGCDSVNLSLGSGNAGDSYVTNAEYQAIMDNLEQAGVVVCISAGNNSNWAKKAMTGGHLYADDISLQTNGSPGSYTNSLCVASVDNDGTTGMFITVDGQLVVYNESRFKNQPLSTLAGEREFILIDGTGTPEDWEAVGDAMKGKIVLCARGGISFVEKGNNAVAAGASATIIYNNEPGIINMDLTEYTNTEPMVSIPQAAGKAIREHAQPVADANGTVLYYKGTMTVSEKAGSSQYDSEFYTMSDFSSWGVPGSLEMKPEITAPGGNIYSVYGTTPQGGGSDQYENMSGTSMAAPQISGMAALAAQYIRAEGLAEKTGLSPRQLAQSLLMSTAEPMVSGESGSYFPVIQQGAGLGNIASVIHADSYITMDENATKSFADGKVKVELGDDPQRSGVYEFSFNIHNMEATEKTFGLSADFFTQKLFEDYANDKKDDKQMAFYMDTQTVSMPVNVTWEVDGKPLISENLAAGLDFDGNGSVNAADGQALLDYVVDNTKSIRNQEKADLDKDGDVDTHDAYLFFKELSSSTVSVPSEGSVKVHVKVELTDAWNKYMQKATNGAYVQGYVFARSLASKEGVMGTAHSIPVLGFCGNWSDASMYDVGTFAEYAAGDEFRAPYLGKINANAYLVIYAEDPDNYYALGGNPLVPDDTYMPERNAINSQNGDAVSRVQFTSIRNAVEGRLTAKNVTKNQELLEVFSGAVGAAFFYPSAGKWRNTSFGMKTNFVPKNAQEGDHILMEMVLAPEYYADSKGNVNWEALGKGTSFSLPLIVDNTAPVLEDISISVMHNTMTVTASDNQYIAAVALFNKAGTKVLSATGSIQDTQPGATNQYVLDLSEVNGKKFTLQVMDYAMNTATYVLDMEIGEEQPLPEMIAYTLTSKYWFAFDKDTEYAPENADGLPPYGNTKHVFTAATIADHIVMAVTEDGDLYAMPEDDLSEENLVGNVGMEVTDMAFNKANGQVYGVNDNNLFTIDKFTGEVTNVGTIGIKTNTLACDPSGVFYCNEFDTVNVYKFTLDTMANPTLLGKVDDDVDITSKYIQSMEINPNNNMLCWNSFSTEIVDLWDQPVEASYSYYIEMDTKTGKATVYNDLWEEICALIIPERTSGNGWADPTDQVTNVILSAKDLQILKGTSKQLTAVVQPWMASDRTVSWKSSDETVAVVDEQGMITGKGVGTATITATSKLNPKISAQCKVTVDKLNVTVKGMLQNTDGKAQLFSWNLAEEDQWTAGNSVDAKLASATFDTEQKCYYVQEDSKQMKMHKLAEDGSTMETSTSNGVGIHLWDMAYSPFFSGKETAKVSGISGYYFLTPKDPMNLDTNAFDMQNYCEYLTAIASLGQEKFTDTETGQQEDTEHIVLLTKEGRVIHFWIYQNGDAMDAWLKIYPSNIELPFRGNTVDQMFCSMVGGNDGALYLSYFTGKSNELYRLTLDEKQEQYHADIVCSFGENVWPAIVTEVTGNTPAEHHFVPANPEKVESVTVTEEELQTAAQAAEKDHADRFFEMSRQVKEAKAEIRSESEAHESNRIVTVTITVKDENGADIASTNGLITAAYDASKLELVDVISHSTYTSQIQEPGKVTLGYVSLNKIPAGGAVATLKLKALATEESNMTLHTLQVNNQKGGQEELKIQFAHENTEVRDAAEATCTEEGYTGDTYCLDCGELIEKGEVIPAKGHQWSQWETTQKPSCFHDGERIRTCSVCGEVEKEIIPGGDGHNCPCNRFVDLSCTKWYHEGVDYVLANDIMIGIDEDHFKPNGKITRAQMVTMLYRLADSPAVTGENPFQDVQEDRWYTDAVLWAAEEGITDGISQTLFAPGSPVTREQMATFLYRYAELNGRDVSAAADLSKFADGGAVHAFAEEAMAWAVAEGLIEGMDNRLYPTIPTTRAQGATVLMRYSK